MSLESDQVFLFCIYILSNNQFTNKSKQVYNYLKAEKIILQIELTTQNRDIYEETITINKCIIPKGGKYIELNMPCKYDVKQKSK